MRHFHPAILVLAPIGLIGCSHSRISGTYVAHADDGVLMLQLVETDNGQVNGVLTMRLPDSKGGTELKQAQVTGSEDGGHLMLSVHYILTAQWTGDVRFRSLQMQIAAPDGSLQTVTFKRGSSDDFREYSDQLQAKAKAKIEAAAQAEKALNANRTIAGIAGEVYHVSGEINSFRNDLKSHADRIEKIRSDYKKIEDNMANLLQRERGAANTVQRGQISVAISQQDVGASQVNFQVENTWKDILRSADVLQAKVYKLAGSCAVSDSYWISQGAVNNPLTQFRGGCKELMAEKTAFDAVYRDAKDKASQVAGIERDSAQRRQALINESERIE